MNLRGQIIKVMALMPSNADPKPLKIKIHDENNIERLLKIYNVLSINHEKLAGNKMIKYICECQIAEDLIYVEIKYELDTCLWYLINIKTRL